MNEQSSRDIDFVTPEELQAKQQAGELFVHGVMQQLYRDTPLERERRIQRVMSELAQEAGQNSAHKTGPTWRQNALRFSRVWLTSAAALALFASMIWVGISTEKSADATVAASIQAMRSAGDSRFEVRSKLFSDSDLSTEPLATIDTREPGLMLLKSKGPESKGQDSKGAPGLTVGRDAEGVWAIRRDGTIERDNPEQRWPRWSMLGEESLFADSVDQLLETLSRAYVIRHSEASKLAGRGDVKFSHLTGTKKRVMQPGPRQIDVWIDPETNVVERIEIRFEKPPLNLPGQKSPSPHGEGRRPEFEGGVPAGPGGPNGPRNRPDRLGPPPSGERADRPERPDHAGEFAPGDKPQVGPEGRPIGPPPRPEGEIDRRPDGARPDHIDRQGLPGDSRGPQNRLGPGPDRGPRPGPGLHHGPRGRPDPMRGPRGERLPPLELLVIDRVTPPDFADGYFDAAKYAVPATPEVVPAR